MTVSGRLASLMARKAQIESDLQREATAPYQDHWRLVELKKRKLALNDEIQRTAHSG